jgi:hypothetical protein
MRVGGGLPAFRGPSFARARGLSTFSTMMGVDMDSPPREGPFVPSDTYEGDIRGTPALEAWVLRIAAQRAGNP